MVLKRAAEHKGTSFVEIYQNCNVFNDGAWDYATGRDSKADTLLELEHGKPLIFGKDRDKGIRLNGMTPEIVALGKGISEDDLLFHDERAAEPSLAYLLCRMRHPEFPEPIGVFRAVDAPCYEDMLEAQIVQARKTRGPGAIGHAVQQRRDVEGGVRRFLEFPGRRESRVLRRAWDVHRRSQSSSLTGDESQARSRSRRSDLIRLASDPLRLPKARQRRLSARWRRNGMRSVSVVPAPFGNHWLRLDELLNCKTQRSRTATRSSSSSVGEQLSSSDGAVDLHPPAQS